MADGTITIKIASNDDAIKKTTSSFKNFEDGTKKANSGLKNMVVALGLVKVAGVAIGVLKNSLDDAVSRFDTMQKFPKVMSSLGYSTKASTNSINQLAAGIDGLPTKLDDIVGVTQQLTSTTGDLEKSTQAALGLNNAFLASGASTEDASRGMIQYTQMLAKGKVDLQSWRTIQEAMPIGLKKTAEAMGFVGKTATTDLYDALKNGEVTFDQFQDKIIELGTGTGELAELAKINSEGIGTSFGNLKNSISKNVANIITKFDEIVTKLSGNSIAGNIDGIKVLFNTMGTKVVESMDMIIPIFQTLVKWLKNNEEQIKGLAKVLGTGLAAFLAYKAVVGVMSAISGAISLIGSKLKNLTTALAANPFAVLIGALAVAYTNSEKFRGAINTLIDAMKNHPAIISGVAVGIIALNVALNASKITAYFEALKSGVKAAASSSAVFKTLTAIQTAYTAGTSAAGAATVASSAQVAFLGGTATVSAGAMTLLTIASGILRVALLALPFVALAVGAVALVAGVIALVKWMNKGTEANQKNEKSLKGIKQQGDDLNKQIKESKKNHEESQKAIESNSEALKSNINQIDELTKKEKLSGAEKVLLKKAIDDVNNSAEGLNLKYDEQSGKLNMSTENLKENAKALTDISSASEQVKSSTDELTKLKDISTQISGQLKTLEDEQKKYNLQLQSGEIFQGEYTKSMNETNDQIDVWKGRAKDNANAQQAAAEQIAAAQQLIADAAQGAATNAGEALLTLTEDQEKFVETLQSKVQEARDAILGMNDEIDFSNQTSASKWLETTQKNTATMDQFANNINSLTGRVSEEFLGYLKDLGPEGALLVSQLAPMSEEGLKQFEEAFAKTGTTALDNVKAGLNSNELPEAILGLVGTARGSLDSEIKAAGFDKLGGDVASGMAQGVKEGDKNVSDAVKDVAKNAQEATKKANDSHSPSKVYKGFGNDMMDGLVLGIKDNQSDVVKAMRDILENAKKEWKSLKSDLNKIGYNAMSGLNDGLIAMAPFVYSTARTIANNIANEMKKALDIHSPSRVARNEIGAMYSKGLALGIEDNYSEIEKSINRMNDLFLPRVKSQEFAVDNAGTYSSPSQNINNVTTNNQTSKAEINIYFDNANLISGRDIEETGIALAEQLERELRGRLW